MWRKTDFISVSLYLSNVDWFSIVFQWCRPAIPRGPIPKGPQFSAISSGDNLRLGIRLGLGLGSVVWLWQYQELFRATTMNNGLQNGGRFGMADRNLSSNSSAELAWNVLCELLAAAINMYVPAYVTVQRIIKLVSSRKWFIPKTLENVPPRSDHRRKLL